MTKIRRVGGNATYITRGTSKIFAKDIEINSNGRIDYYAPNYTYGEPEPRPVKEEPEIAFSGWWSPDYEGMRNLERDERGSKSYLEKTVYFQLTVSKTIPVGTVIHFKLWDYDTGLFLDWLNPDDDEFSGKEVIKTGIVRDVEGKHRITIELFLNPTWNNEIRKDIGPFKDGCIDLYWTWKYNNHDWTSNTNLLSVYPSNVKLRIKPAFDRNTYSLPEIYSRKGYIIVFAIDQLPSGEIQKFVSLKIRSTTKFQFTADIQKFKKEIYTETINIKKNRLESVSYEVEEISHFFYVKENVTNIFIDEKIVEVPVARSSTIAVFNKIKKVINFGKIAAEIFTYHQVLDELRNMMPEISNNGKFNTPSVSTALSFVPGYQIAAFGIFIFEWMVQDLLEQADQNLDELMWIEWQNVKTKGLDAVMSFIENNSWAQKNFFYPIPVNSEIMNDLFTGKLKTRQQIIDKRFTTKQEMTHILITYGVEDSQLETYFDVVDCIIMKEEI
ncbi:hypothetical protein [Flavobacterium hungaricum]|uniref:Uncharacterized protein n=1 Tax=Flavobacterium hungaricum TaxID=2082725 RepID=A0ABR9TGT7_9FLAO|nr:hypothetical protein [Flavobacterium hungaricum]MBE8724242.1 hypothetical protein [Flavobacterium hungaricum]